MKIKKLGKALPLKKETIVNLDDSNMIDVRGGVNDSYTGSCCGSDFSGDLEKQDNGYKA